MNAQNCNGDSPLSIAALHGRTELLSIVLQYGEKLSMIHMYSTLPQRLRNVKMSEEP